MQLCSSVLYVLEECFYRQAAKAETLSGPLDLQKKTCVKPLKLSGKHFHLIPKFPSDLFECIPGNRVKAATVIC